MPPDDLIIKIEIVPPPLDFYQFKAADWQSPPTPLADKHSPQKIPDDGDWLILNPDSLPFSCDLPHNPEPNKLIAPITLVHSATIHDLPPKIISVQKTTLNQSRTSSHSVEYVINKNQVIYTPVQPKLWVVTLQADERGNKGYVPFNYKVMTLDQYKGPRPDFLRRTANIFGEQGASAFIDYASDYAIDFFVDDYKAKKQINQGMNFVKGGINVYLNATWETGVRETTRSNIQALSGYARHYSQIIIIQTRQVGGNIVTYTRQLGSQAYIYGSMAASGCYVYGAAGVTYVTAAATIAAPYVLPVVAVAGSATGGYLVGTGIYNAAENGWTVARWIRRPIQFVTHNMLVDTPDGYQWEYDSTTGHYECREIKNPLKTQTQQNLSQLGFYTKNATFYQKQTKENLSQMGYAVSYEKSTTPKRLPEEGHLTLNTCKPIIRPNKKDTDDFCVGRSQKSDDEDVFLMSTAYMAASIAQ